MSLTSFSRSCTITLITILVWICHFQIAFAAVVSSDTVLPSTPSSGNINDTHPGLICTPFGACERCPESSSNEPFCQPFGNRRLMHCVNASSSLIPPHHDKLPNDQYGHGVRPGGSRYSSSPPFDSDTDFDIIFKLQHPEGETPAWESCGRIVDQEQADFLEFVLCNVLFASVALVILGIRSKRMHALQARQLAARIGVARNNTGTRR